MISELQTRRHAWLHAQAGKHKPAEAKKWVYLYLGGVAVAFLFGLFVLAVPFGFYAWLEWRCHRGALIHPWDSRHGLRLEECERMACPAVIGPLALRSLADSKSSVYATD